MHEQLFFCYPMMEAIGIILLTERVCEQSDVLRQEDMGNNIKRMWGTARMFEGICPVIFSEPLERQGFFG